MTGGINVMDVQNAFCLKTAGVSDSYEHHPHNATSKIET